MHIQKNEVLLLGKLWWALPPANQQPSAVIFFRIRLPVLVLIHSHSPHPLPGTAYILQLMMVGAYKPVLLSPLRDNSEGLLLPQSSL